MTSDEKRAANIIEAAARAVSKMADPAKRDAANAKLQLTQKKVAKIGRQSMIQATHRQLARDHELDIDR